MFAVVRSGGKQYKVSAGDVVKLEKIEAEAGKTIQLNEVLAVGEGKNITVGAPTISGAVVTAEVLSQERDKKVLVFKKKRRHNYRRKNGHRQYITLARITVIAGEGGKKLAEAAPLQKKEKKAATSQEAAAPKKAEAKPAAKKAEAPKKKAPAAKKEAATKTPKKEG